MIGIYDSGVGGLVILTRVRALLPDADLVYLADQANVPYGERPLAEVRDLAATAVRNLVERGATTVVVACNTATAAAIGHLRESFPAVTVIGMEPAVKPAAISTRSGIIGVLATDATFAGARFEDLVGRWATGVDVIAHPCPGWAAAVEDGWPDGAREPVRAHLAPLLARGIDTLVLACTHYTFLAGVIGEIVGDDVTVVDPSDAVARHTVAVATGTGTGTTTFLTTGDPRRFADQVRRLIGLEVTADAV